MKSLTYNVVITKSTDAMRNLFFPKNRQRTSFDSFFKENKSNNNYLVLSPRGGNGFLELDFNFPISTNSTYVSLKLIDTAAISEFFAVDRHPVDTLVIDRIAKEISLPSTQSDYALFRALENLSNKFYISFGCGDDVRTWSGPYVMNLTDAKLSYDSVGVKIVELLFTPNPQSIRTFGDSLLLDSAYGQAESMFDSKLIQHEGMVIKDDVTFNLKTGAKEPSPGYKSDIQPQWNYWIRLLIIKYINNLFEGVPRGNILALFSTDLDERPTTGNPDGKTPEEKEGRNAIINTKEPIGDIYDFNKILLKMGISLRLVFGNNSDPWATQPPVNETQTRITQAISSSGAKIVDATTNIVANTALGLLGNNVINDGQGIMEDVSQGSFLASNADNHQTSPNIAAEQDKAAITMATNLNLNNSSDRFQGPIKPLVTFIKRLREHRKSNQEFVFFEETDVRVLKILKENGIIKDDKYSAIIFGEKSIVKKLIYPSKTLDVNPKPSVNDLKLGASLTYMGDPALFPNLNFKKYSESYVNEFLANRGRTSSFGEKIDLQPYASEFKSMIKDDEFVFMHNVKNSNVLDVSFENKGYQANMLMLASESKIKNQAQAAAAGVVLKDNELKYRNLIEYIKKTNFAREDLGYNGEDVRIQILDLLRNNQRAANLVWLAKEFNGSDTEDANESTIDFVDVINFIVQGHELPNPGPRIITEPGERHKAYADMLESLLKTSKTARIKTLPFFNHPQLYERHCFLYGLQNNIKGSVLSDKLNYAVFTGRYKIIGARHFMSPTEAFSQFDLVKADLVTSKAPPASFSPLKLGRVIKPFKKRITNEEWDRYYEEQWRARLAEEEEKFRNASWSEKVGMAYDYIINFFYTGEF
jgi:hypothetical protein